MNTNTTKFLVTFVENNDFFDTLEEAKAYYLECKEIVEEYSTLHEAEYEVGEELKEEKVLWLSSVIEDEDGNEIGGEVLDYEYGILAKEEEGEWA